MSQIDAFAEGRDGDVAGLLRELDGWSARIAGTLDELAAARMEGADASGAVRARVAGTGRLLDLRIDAKGLRELDHLRLAAAVMEAVGAARAAAGERLEELTAGLAGPRPAGPEDPLAAHVQRVMREG
ncbi:YbaB/EbfC family nucleoid-associated protein [Actinomadura sp. ATCC 31491]|uniref:YbaB/EbfC family nucleoid-associated protein n=1 Tax=Actinomadura luzonensis TaxID=2805427 RepID=A0ABT0G9M0_9ACTN|nr:YbaB/EbfC family nucleoid-associated protein [Actinomadura luzonensis]MCK2221303.1 YbaB/EbfC family nucleoid-associated protein [Actinomadura luzonensis]